jgi:nicotinamide riboside kinase
MLYGKHDPWFDSWNGCADLYLLFDIDLPWIEDGTRMFGTPQRRKRFFDLSQEVLERRGVRWVLIDGEGEQRYLNALKAILGTEKAMGGA